MAEQLESDRATSKDARTAAIVICLIILAVVTFALIGKLNPASNEGAAPTTGETGLKSGVEGATTNPQVTTPH